MKKIVNTINKILQFFNIKKMAWLTSGIFILSLLPIFYLADYDYASGDDFGYGALAHQVWMQTHSFVQLFKTLGGVVRQYYYGWQGTWFSLVLFQFQPAVFNERAYVIVPYLALFCIVGSTSLLLYYLLVKICNMPRSLYAIVTSLLLFASIQFIPRTTSGIFWYNGVAHYIIPHAMALLAIYCLLRFVMEKKKRFYVYGFLLMILLGGVNYLSALLAFLGILLLLICTCRIRRESLYLLLPLLAEGIGLFISMIAPGNKVRGGTNFGFTFEKVCLTVGESVKSAVENIGFYFREKPLVFLLLLVAALFIWEAYMISETTFSFSYPLLILICLFGVYCAMFAPGIYAAVDTSGGVPNNIYLTFVLTMFLSAFYLLGWLQKELKQRKSSDWIEKHALSGNRWKCLVQLPILLLLAVILLLSKGPMLKQSTDFYCIDFVRSGRAEDYKEQMEERLLLLTDPAVQEVVVPEMNSDQYPFMHMALMGDSKEWTNTVTAKFYGKKSIVAIPRSAYNTEKETMKN